MSVSFQNPSDQENELIISTLENLGFSDSIVSKLRNKLHGHPLEAYVTWTEHIGTQSKCPIIMREHSQPSRSFVSNMIGFMYVNFANLGTGTGDTVPTKLISGVSTILSNGTNYFLNQATPGTLAAPAGLVVGTGSGANTSATQSALGTLIASGTTASTLAYGSMTNQKMTVSSADTTMLISRQFTNNSGGSITINEVGLYTNTVSASNTAGSTWMIARDLVTQTITNGNSATCTYTIKCTV